MATNLVQGLLQSLQPWLTGGSPSALDNANAQYGGTSGLISAMLQDSPGSQGAAAMGRAMQGIQDDALNRASTRQSLAQQQLGLQFMAARMPLMLQRMRQLAGGDAGQQSAPQPSDAPPMIRATPQQLAASGQPQNYLPPPASRGGGPGQSAMDLLRSAQFDAMWNPQLANTEATVAKTQLQYNPQLSTQMALSKSAMVQDQLGYQQAMKAGNPQAAQAWYMKYLKDAGMVNVAAYNGAVTTMGGITPAQLGVSTINPVQGVGTQNGAEFALPGAAGARAAIAGAQAGAQERARLAAQTAPAGNTPRPPPGSGFAGSVPPQTQPNVSPLPGNAAIQQEGYIPPILAAPSRIQQRPGNTSLAELKIAQEGQAENAKEIQKNLDEQSSNAQSLLTQASQIDDAARSFAPGKLADAKRELMAWGQQFGMLSPESLKSLGSAQEGDKLSIQLQAMVTKQLGSREAAQVFSVMGRSIPNLTLSPDGLGKISAYLKGIARYQQAQNIFGQRLMASGNVAGVNSLQSNFQTYTNPVYYILASAPRGVAQEFIANMAPGERAKIQAGWKQAISQGLAPSPGDYE